MWERVKWRKSWLNWLKWAFARRTQTAHTESLAGLSRKITAHCPAPPMTCIGELLLYNNLHVHHLPANCSHCPPTCYIVNSGNPCERLWKSKIKERQFNLGNNVKVRAILCRESNFKSTWNKPRVFSAECEVFPLSCWSASVSFLGSSACRIHRENTKTRRKINTVSNKVGRKESNPVAKSHLSLSVCQYVSRPLGKGLHEAWKGLQNADTS